MKSISIAKYMLSASIIAIMKLNINTVMFNRLIIIVLVFSGLIIYKLIKDDFKFVLKSLESIDNRVYEINQLPKLKAFFKEEKELEMLVHQIFNRQKLTKDIKEVLMKYYEMDELMEMLYSEISELLQIDRIAVAFIDYENKKIIAEYGVANYSKIFLEPGYEVKLKDTRLSTIIEDRKLRISNDLLEDYRQNPKSTSLSLVIKEGIRSNIVIPLVANNEVMGMFFLSSKKENHFSKGRVRIANDIISEISGCIIRTYLTKVMFTKTSMAFSRLVDIKDNETGDHLGRMTSYSLAIVHGLRKVNIKGYEMNKKIELDIRRYAAVHDIGKVVVPDSVLKKPGKLDSQEWEIMKQHVQVGVDVFREIRKDLRFFDSTFFKAAEEIVLGHHEKWDGSGYPNGLKGQEIPLVARIVAIGDVFDALLSKRVYKEAFEFNKVVNIVIESSGTHFDPILVEVFKDNLDNIKAIYDKVKLGKLEEKI